MSQRRSGGPRGDYEVGYGRPPTSTRFVKGQSGNPVGRRKRAKEDQKAKTQTQLVHEISQRRINITFGGKPLNVSMLEAVIIKTFKDALEGKQDAVRTIFRVGPAVEEMRRREPEIPDDAELTELAKDPEAIAATYRRLFGPKPQRGSR